MAQKEELPKTLMNFIRIFIKKQKGAFIAVQLLALAWAFDNTVWPYVLKVLIDKISIFTGDKSDLWVYLMPLLITWVIVWLLIDVGYRTSGIIATRVFPRMESDIRMAMFDYVQGHSYDFFANHFAGNISNRISDMTQSATRALQMLINLFIPASLAFVISTTIFLTINAWFALLLAGWTVLHIGICLFAASHLSKVASSHSNARSILTGKVVDVFTNIINVKLFSRSRYEHQYINQFQQIEREKHVSSMMFGEKIKVALSISSFIFPGVVLTWYIIYSWQHGYLTLGDVVLIFNLTWNMQHLAWYAGLELPNLFKEIGICQQALSIIQAKHDINDAPHATTLHLTQGKIEFRHVNFRYHAKNQVFNDMNVTIAPGSKVGLVGFSGSGKSTFVNLIMRFFDIESGKILLDDQDISQVTLNSLRSQISMIPQDPTLFHRTLKENIRYGKLEATHDEIIAAAKHAHCDEFIQALPEGFESLVGERGIKLSGGQRQRIAIARAILEDAPILILDEATSALDSVTEKRIQDGLHYLMQGKTTLVIAHRLSTLSEMDRILVFDNGVIIEDGDHQHLLNINGHYATMWHMQAGGFLPDSPSDVLSTK